MRAINKVTREQDENSIKNECNAIVSCLTFHLCITKEKAWQLFNRAVQVFDTIQQEDTSIDWKIAKLRTLNFELSVETIKKFLIDYFFVETIWPPEILIYCLSVAYKDITDDSFPLREHVISLSKLFVIENS